MSHRTPDDAMNTGQADVAEDEAAGTGAEEEIEDAMEAEEGYSKVSLSFIVDTGN